MLPMRLIFDRVGAHANALRKSVGQKLSAANCKLQVTYCCSVPSDDEEFCTLLVPRDQELSTETFIWTSQRQSTTIAIQNFEPPQRIEPGTHEALEIVLCDLCYFLSLHPPNDPLTIDCSKTLIKDLFACDLAQNDQLPCHLIELLCSLALGSVKSRVGEVKHIKGISENEHRKFTITEDEDGAVMAAEWSIFDSSDSQFSQTFSQKIQTIGSSNGHSNAVWFVLFDELQCNLSTHASSDSLPTSSISMIKILSEESQLSLQITTIDPASSGFYFSYNLKGTVDVETREHYKDDKILNSIIEGYINGALTCTLTCVCIPCKSSIWYYNSINQNVEDSAAKADSEQLCLLAAEGNFQELMKKPASGIDERCPDFLNRTPLLCAAAAATFLPFGDATEDHTNCATALIFCGADPTAADEKGRTAVHNAVNSANNLLLEFLLGIGGVDCDSESHNGWTPLMIAANSDNAEAARLLLRAGADADKRNGDGESVDSICDKIESLEVKGVISDRSCVKALHQDQKFNCDVLTAVRSMAVNQLDAGSIATQSVVNASLVLSRRDCIAIIFRMLRGITDPELMTQCCISAARAASNGKNWELITAILLHVTQCQYKLLDSSDMISSIIDSVTADLKQQDLLLSFLVTLIRQESSQQLLQRILPKDLSWLNTALRCSIFEGRVALAEILLPHVTDPNLPDSEGRTALMLAADIGQDQLIVKLLDKGASVTAEDNQGLTALSRACRAGHVRAAKALIDRGADVNHKDRRGRSCLGLAPDSVRHLLQTEQKAEKTDDPSDEALSIELHQLLNDAGFTQQRAKFQCDMADFLQHVAQQTTQEEIHLVGSFSEGWGSCLKQMNGRIATDSGIDWAVIQGSDEFHLEGNCKCDGVTRVSVAEGRVLAPLPAGSQRAISAAPCGVRPAQDVCHVYPCCSSCSEDRVQRLLKEPGRVYLVRDFRQDSQTSEDELRVDFSFQEKQIMRKLSVVQGQLFTLIKIIFKRVLPNEYKVFGLSSYHAKTLLFFMLDRHRYNAVWQPRNLLSLLRESLILLTDFMHWEQPNDIGMLNFFLDRTLKLLFWDSGNEPQLTDIRRCVLDLCNMKPDKIMQSLINQLDQLESDHFHSHIFSLIPLFTKPASLGSNDDYALVYNTVYQCLKQLQLHDLNRDAMLNQLRHLPEWCKTARLCLEAMVHFKFGEKDEATNLLSEFSGHKVQRSWDLKVKLPPTDDVKLRTRDWAWRFCLPFSEQPNFTFLSTAVSRLITFKRSTPDHLYINFRCLWLSLQAESITSGPPEILSEFLSAWESELQTDPEAMDYFALAHFSRSFKQVQRCLDAMKLLNKGSSDGEDMLRTLEERCDELLRDDTTPQKMTVLCNFAEHGQVDRLREFLTNENCNCRGETGMTPLMCAARARGSPNASHAVCAELLLSHKADTEAKDPAGWTSLHFAAACGNTSVGELLLKNGAKVNGCDSKGNSALIIATEVQHMEHMNFMELLLRAGANSYLANNEGMTAFSVAQRVSMKHYAMEILSRWVPTVSFDSKIDFTKGKCLGKGGNAKVFDSDPPGDTVLRRIDISKSEVKGIDALQHLRHRNIAQLIKCEKSDSKLDIYLEKVHGETIEALLKNGPFRFDMCIDYTRQMSNALSYLHNNASGPVIHRDIKSTNIMVSTEHGIVKLIDFGLAQGPKSTASKSDSGLGTYTSTHRGMVGTLYYMAPEIFDVSDPVHNTHSDVWAFGCVIFQMATGALPFRGETIQQQAKKINISFPSIDTKEKGVWKTQVQSLQHLFEQCTKKEPAQRVTATGIVLHEILRQEYETFGCPFVKRWDTVLLLGRGSFGNVHEVLTDKGIRCAAKIIRLPVQTGNQQDKIDRQIEKMIDGERNLCKLIHINIVSFLWILLQDAELVVFMEFLDGDTLENLLDGKALDEDKIAGFGSQICSALQYLHSQEPPVIHRDIKCGNIMVLSESSRVKLIDFGLSLKLQETLTHYSASTMTPKGTLHFMAPELLGADGSEESIRYSRESDIWALGCTVYQMATGTLPHSGCSNMLAMALTLERKGAPSLPGSCSRELKSFYTSCVARDRRKRKSAADLLSHEFLTAQRHEDSVVGGAKGGFGAFLRSLRPKKH